MNKNKVIIDGPYLARKSYAAPFKLTTSTGLNSTMIFTFLRTLKSICDKTKPTEVLVGWESHGTKSWRTRLYPNYKQRTRCKISKEFWDYLYDVQLFLYFLGIKQFFSSENEADDVIGKLVKLSKCENIIYTTDKDIMQLVNDDTIVFDGKTKYDAEKVKEKFLVEPKYIPDLLAIWGDVSDNIEGVKGYGLRKSARVVNRYGFIENIPQTESVSKYKNKMLFNKKLVTINSNCNIEPIPSNNFKTTETIETLLEKYELNSIKKDIDQYRNLGEAVCQKKK